MEGARSQILFGTFRRVLLGFEAHLASIESDPQRKRQWNALQQLGSLLSCFQLHCYRRLLEVGLWHLRDFRVDTWFVRFRVYSRHDDVAVQGLRLTRSCHQWDDRHAGGIMVANLGSDAALTPESPAAPLTNEPAFNVKFRSLGSSGSRRS